MVKVSLSPFELSSRYSGYACLTNGGDVYLCLNVLSKAEQVSALIYRTHLPYMIYLILQSPVTARQTQSYA